MTFTFGSESVAAPPGTFVLVPPGVEHGFRNDRVQPVRMLNIHAPAGIRPAHRPHVAHPERVREVHPLVGHDGRR